MFLYSRIKRTINFVDSCSFGSGSSNNSIIMLEQHYIFYRKLTRHSTTTIIRVSATWTSTTTAVGQWWGWQDFHAINVNHPNKELSWFQNNQKEWPLGSPKLKKWTQLFDISMNEESLLVNFRYYNILSCTLHSFICTSVQCFYWSIFV